jgi:hypothetical protein
MRAFLHAVDSASRSATFSPAGAAPDRTAPDAVAGCGGAPRILLAATLRWPLAARLAIAFSELGCRVEAWCPAGHPLELTRAAGPIHHGTALGPLRSLRAAIRSAAPDFIIPCDDEAALHLHRLHRDSRASVAGDAQRSLIERSLGAPAACALSTDRGALMRLALAQGVRVPETCSLAAIGDLDGWAVHGGFPAVLKTDCSWGGLGVAVVGDLGGARTAYRVATRPSLLRVLSQLVLRRDPAQLLRWLRGARPGVTIQKFIVGSPANRAVACWRGEVLAGISVVALQTQAATGPATVVQVVENQEMSETARRLLRALGLSGLCGLDFVIEAATGAAWLIEVNPRATPISHLALGSGPDLPAALHARLGGRTPSAPGGTVAHEVVAMFPGELRRDPLSPYLRNAFHDVPWAETGLVRDCVGLPWEERGIAARLRARLSPRRAEPSVAFPSR